MTPPPTPAAPAADDAVAGPAEARNLPVAEGDDAAMVRINLRLPANLKALIEDAAAAGGLSGQCLDRPGARRRRAGQRGPGGATRPAPAQKPDRFRQHSGWVR